MGSARSHLLPFTVLVLAVSFLTTEAVTSEMLGKAGNSVEMQCSWTSSEAVDASSGSPHVVEWIRQGLDIPVLIKFGSYPPRVHPQYEGRVSLVQITNLRVEALQLEDQGLYECRTLLLDKPTEMLKNGSWTLLSVTAPPIFKQSPPLLLEALFGARLTLTCVANGNPAPIITWFKDGKAIQQSNDKGGVLLLPAVNMQSAGQYICLASNSEGNVTQTTKVKIKGPPVIVVPPTSTSINISQNALLQCQAVADPPNMTYVWLKNGENVYHKESLKSRVKIMVDGTLLIVRVTPEDSGNYTCVPTNGLLTPPAASANLTVLHPARALPLPEETYLPTGMDGGVYCPVAANPPLLRVDWTKDGQPLDLSLFPGWSSKPGGSLFMATVNDDAAGVYTCTPYNSYGSMGPSGPTNVILQEPPSFSVTPQSQYEQEVGRTLSISCQGNKDPTIKVTWSKVDVVRLVSYFIEANGSLLLQPVLKEHQGTWTCTVTNRVASVEASTLVNVLGTSPHSASSLSVSPGVRQANVSWEAGFDGGSTQTFSVWVKEISASGDDKKKEWFSMLVPSSSGTAFQVKGLSPATHYQFSVLSKNKIGTGPFSDIETARTLDPPVRRRPPQPPESLTATRGPAGVLLQWSHPGAQQSPITGFALQSRTGQAAWFSVDDNVSANATEMMVPGLHKDCVYELRLLSRSGELLSERGPSVNVSTVGMEIYPSTSQLLDSVPEPLLAGVLSGVGFMFLALVLLLGLACFISHKRNQRRRKRKEEPHSSICKFSPSIKTSDTSSPDSMLKKSLLPARSLYPTTSSTTTSASFQTDSSSFSSGNPYRHEQLLPRHGKSFHAEATSALLPPHIESISRGRDGRFALPLSDDYTQSFHSKRGVRYTQQRGVPHSVSLCSEREDRKERPFVLSVDLPLYEIKGNFTSQHDNVGLHRNSYDPDSKASCDGFPDLGSACSGSSLATIPHPHREPTPTFPVLPHLRGNLGKPSTTISTLVLQMEHERERKNLSRCLELAQEREELERELHRYTMDCGSQRRQPEQERTKEHRSHSLPHRYSHSFLPVFSTDWDDCSQVPPHCDSSPPSPSKVSGSGGPRLNHGTTTTSLHSSKNRGISPLNLPNTSACFEMCVDEPGEVSAAHKEQDSHVEHGLLLTNGGSPDVLRRSLSSVCHSRASVENISNITDPLQPVEAKHWRTPIWESKKRSQSLDLRRQKEGLFLAPNAWIHSLSQENCSAVPGRRPGHPWWKPPSSASTGYPPPDINYLSPRSNQESPSPNPDVTSLCEPRVEGSAYSDASTWSADHREARGLSEEQSSRSPQTVPGPAVRGSDPATESGSSYSSYASSGRGSMEPANHRLSLSRLSPVIKGSAGEDPRGREHQHSHHMETNQRRKASVDENYEWDPADISTQPGNQDGLFSSLTRLKPARHCSHPSMHCSPRALKNPSQPSLPSGLQSCFSDRPHADMVLF